VEKPLDKAPYSSPSSALSSRASPRKTGKMLDFRRLRAQSAESQFIASLYY
jgi:hypothetical protein